MHTTCLVSELLGFNHGKIITRRPLGYLLLFSLLFLHAAAQNPNPPSFNQYDGGIPHFDKRMAVVMILLVLVFFTLGFLSVYTRRCAQRRFRGGVDLGLGAGWVSRGLDASVIETFPTFVYSSVKGLKIGKGSLECAVCLNEFQDNETLRLIPKCDHVFHPDCIDAWLVSHTTCPVCRANLVPRPGETSRESHPLSQLLDRDSDAGQPENVPDCHVSIPVEDDHYWRAEESPEINLIDASKVSIDQSRPPRSRSTGFGTRRSRSTGLRFSGLFPRSRSTGHLLVQPGENRERFTLRLPEDVRNQLVNSTLYRTKSSSVALPRVGSARRGYRSGSVGVGRPKNCSYYERFDPNPPPERWVFSMTPPFISQSGSVRSRQGMDGNNVSTPAKGASSESSKPPSDSLITGMDDVVERSSGPLRPEHQV
ncbi:hypothetical protein UlMin_034793 [Ulmus minor]